MSQHPPVRAVQIFLIALAVAVPDFVLAKSLGWDDRSWHVILSAAIVTASLIAMSTLVASSLKATSR